uniref:Uncharacterized protein n=1 Tax=Oryza nivara TaxID=4536 RepID=A0A0E0HS21_ORYNI
MGGGHPSAVKKCRSTTDDADTETPSPRSRLYVFIRASLLLSVFFLAANANGRGHVLVASVDLFHSSWVRFCAAYVSPPLQLLADVCVVCFLVQSADCLVWCLGCLYIHLNRIKPKPISSPAIDRERERERAGGWERAVS